MEGVSGDEKGREREARRVVREGERGDERVEGGGGGGEGEEGGGEEKEEEERDK